MGNPVILCKGCSRATAVYFPLFTAAVLAWYVIKKEEIRVFTTKKKKKEKMQCRLEVPAMTARQDARLSGSKISNAHAENSQKCPSLRLNCLHNLADLSPFTLSRHTATA